MNLAEKHECLLIGLESLTYTSFKFPKLNRLVVQRRLYLYVMFIYLIVVELHKSNSYHQRASHISQTTGCQTWSNFPLLQIKTGYGFDGEISGSTDLY
ncbi:hypothetical protein DP113_20635 [Brasilonema octagenarum UFV-E1]|uniref:Uncharacterized protein n=1 Tax=Brasilonema sennae CENA114 TaxID=415709 RepID=A0A856MLC2_9CYAN|nr:hypothetical protein [Brasilonema sennae]QDL09987.1 hypothetical protein DP114_20710 [Brasilonema sennae CENA114]QDL16339.1 hypothetical protein DP113_20635 [Brasilonema octagenarum UFV-E1]